MEKDTRKISLLTGFSIMLFLIIQLLTALFVHIKGLSTQLTSDPKVFFIYSSVFSSFLSVAIPFGLFYVISKKALGLKTDKKEYFTTNKFSYDFNFFTIGLFFILFINLGSTLVNQIFESLGHTDPTQFNFTPTSLLDVIYLFASIALFPALFEEFAFRFCLFDILRKKGSLFASIVVSIIFGLMHGNFFQAFFAMGVSLVFCYILLKTNNIVLCFLLHLINNGISAIIFLFQYFKIEKIGMTVLLSLLFVIIIYGIIAFNKYKKMDIVSIKEIKESFKRQNKVVYKKYFIPWMIIPIILLIVLATISFITI